MSGRPRRPSAAPSSRDGRSSARLPHRGCGCGARSAGGRRARGSRRSRSPCRGKGPAGCARLGIGRAIGTDSRVGSRSFMSWRLAPACAIPIGMPAASVRSERFAPPWLCQWDWGRSSARREAPWSSPRRPPARPSRSRSHRRSRAGPGARSRGRRRLRSQSWKRRCAEEEWQIPVAFSAFHCIPVRRTRRIASIASRSGTRGL